MGIEIPGADWQPTPMDEAMRRFAIDNDDMDSLLDDGRRDHVLVHHGDLIVDGPLAIRGRAPQLHIIGGDLTVNGAFSFQNADVYTTLVVTGSLSAHNLICLWDALLIVGRSLHVKDLLVTYLTDAASFVVKGSLSAGAWIEAGNRGNIDFVHPPQARLLTPGGVVEDYYGNAHYFGKEADVGDAHEAVLAEFLDNGRLNTDLVRDAMLAGRQVLR